MGLLRHLNSDVAVGLAGRTLIGRSGACGLRSRDPRVSSEHAVLAWRDGAWTLRDLGSRNGTFVNDKPLAPGVELPIIAGATLRFAGDAWVLLDDAQPGPLAIALDDGSRVAADGAVLLLPNGDLPLGSIWPRADGTWAADIDGETRPIEDQQVIEIQHRVYRVYLPTGSDPTVRSDSGIGLHFFVSRDEERVEVEVIGAPTGERLRGRSHLYLLLTLARIRASEASRKLTDRGWATRDDLARGLRVDVVTVNVHLHRIRQDLGRRGESAANLIETRPRLGQVRVATDSLRFDLLDV